MTAQFEVGRIAVTSGADALAAKHLGARERSVAWLLDVVHRHASGDYGTVDEDDWRANDADARSGGRVMSAYEVPCPGCDASPHDRRIWVITDPGHRTTTVLLPGEY